MNIKHKLQEGKVFQKEKNFENALKIYSEILDKFKNHIEAKKQVKKILFSKFNNSSGLTYFLRFEEKHRKYLEEIKNKKQFYELYFLSKHLLQSFKEEFSIYNFLSYSSIQINKNKDALIYLEKSIKINPNIYETNIQYINLLFSLGEFNKAEENINMLLKKNNTDGYLHRLLSRIKKYKSKKDNHIKALKNLFDNKDIKVNDKVNIGFALSNALEKVGKFNDSFDYCIRANDIQDNLLKFDLNQEKVFLEKIMKVFTKEKITTLTITKELKKTPIFIIGMPRSGTSLVEQILSTNSDVYGGGELPFLEDFILMGENKGVLGMRYPTILSNPNKSLLESMFNFYHNKMCLISTNENLVTDKLLGNFRWLGLIKATFKNAKIIHVKRNPVDNCYSIFKSFFTNKTNGYAYNQEKLAKYYCLYHQIMAFWKEIFMDEIYECSYEDLVLRPEELIPKLSNFCGLKWESKMMNFQENKRRVMTVSATQVREKIYTTSIGSWKKNQKDFKKLTSVLEESGFY
tara:strand:- start:358 stop:1908 length:1551 start_codon:yes stop_codon:yes gene_type:complete